MEERDKGPVKVVDRRLFTPDGERRDPSAFEAETRPETSEQQPAGEESPGDGEPAASPLFEGLVAFLVDNAMLSLRAGGPISNFTVFIDFLETLKEKTKGNLAPQEARIIEDALGEMKLVYLQVTTRPPGGKSP